MIVHATVGGGFVVGAETALTVKVSGLGPLALLSVTFAAVAPPGQLMLAVSADPVGNWLTVTCCEDGTAVKLMLDDGDPTTPKTLNVVVGNV